MSDPQRYAGLFVFDFGDWVSVGYTADEIAILLESAEHRGGRAYQVYRVDECGRMELAGVQPRALAAEEIMLFAWKASADAGRDFDLLRKRAAAHPLACRVRLELIDLPEHDPPHVVGLFYRPHAAGQVAAWLRTVGFAGGDIVTGGAEALELYRRSAATPVARCVLSSRVEAETRSKEEVLRTVHQPLQR